MSRQAYISRFQELYTIHYHLCKAIPLTDEEFFNLMLDECRKVTRFKDKSNLTTWGGKIYNERSIETPKKPRNYARNTECPDKLNRAIS